ncbi:bifunctional riboflavin kinase/FAD synthetase [Coralloluteibacterium stylophorae]
MSDSAATPERPRLFRDIARVEPAEQGSVVCIGAFDGLHRGHRALVDRAVAQARGLGIEAVALSFEPLPREFFGRAAPPPRLTLPRAKFEGLVGLGCDRVGLLRFDAAFVARSAENFVEDVLVAHLGAREVWVGPGFRFGNGRAGDIALLRRMGDAHGFAAHEIEPVLRHGERVSASAIRRHLAAGELEAAADLLGRPYAISGRVVRGRQLGRQLGYPTANLRLAGRTAALGGIFAVRVHGVAAMPMPAVASLGTRPTVHGVEPLLEAHLFDFDGDLYGRRIEVEFVARLRDEEKFDTLDALVVQMDADAALARRILGATRTPKVET